MATICPACINSPGLESYCGRIFCRISGLGCIAAIVFLASFIANSRPSAGVAVLRLGMISLNIDIKVRP
ncbi:MAG: TRAP-type mannitol/chloroaromatic compound transport system permease large subunit [Oleiphilaceae bacterium]|jgi:TRAP-type mannitol/chloroaromatic compound transport system permease large subunit